MEITRRDFESSHGVNFLLHSSSDKDVFPDNKPSMFTNILTPPINLSMRENYHCALADIHVAPTQYSLVEDEIESSIQYGVGVFKFDFTSYRWNLVEGGQSDTFNRYLNANKILYTVTPSNSFMGIDNEDIAKNFDLKCNQFMRDLDNSFMTRDRSGKSNIWEQEKNLKKKNIYY